MVNPTIYHPDYHRTASFEPSATATEILAEQGMYAASLAEAREHGGPVTNRMLDAIPEEYMRSAADAGLELNIDVRVHRLHKNTYPASPGWHCDAPIRETAFDDHADKTEVTRSLIGTVSTSPTGVSRTEFATTPVTVNTHHPEFSSEFFKHVNRQLHTHPPGTIQVPDGQWTEFGSRSWHRVSPAVCDGARLFMRISLWVPPPGHRGGLVKTEQTYEQVPAHLASAHDCNPVVS